MKRTILLTVAFTLSAAATVFAAGDEKNGHAYFTKAELPDMTKILPPFPAFESARFVADQSQHLWGKLMRQDEARAAQAQRDAVYSMQTIIDEFGGLFGLEITKEDTPEIYSILQDVCASCDSIYSDAKVQFNRQRPYAYYNEGTLIPEKEEKHRYEGSYPSGHTVFGWTSALLLADINQSPQAMEGLLARGYEFGQSRVISGYHWQSDVDAGRIAGSVLYQLIRSHERFIEQLAKARAEFIEKTGAMSNVPSAPRTVQQEGPARIYRIDGTPATDATRGIVIEGRQKVLRK
ncbi:MAG: phosphatase PAP2 family protein [Bacteroidaceae bacterium]|nr:phosphatase PAP2 family protein [Bacteroidaceae bacterium]